jgi:MFS family permease
MVFTSIGTGVALGTLNTELFPTAYRATASGATAMLATVGGVLSLVFHGQLLHLTGSSWSAVSWLALLVFVVPALLAGLPETSGRTLEEIAPER